MVTHYPQRMASENRLRNARVEPAEIDGFVARARSWLRQAFCGLRGHDNLLQFGKDCMYLRCVSCDHETAGWDLADLPRPTIVARGDARRHAMARPHLVTTRRIA